MCGPRLLESGTLRQAVRGHRAAVRAADRASVGCPGIGSPREVRFLRARAPPAGAFVSNSIGK